MRYYLSIIFLGCISMLVTSCGSSTTSSTPATSGYSVEKPSQVLKIVGAAVSTTGSGLVSSSSASRKARHAFSSSMCSSHGDPNSTNSSESSYAGKLTYCKMTVNDGSPDTVQGAFELPRGISCALEKAGMTWDGAPHTVTLTLDTDCFTAEQISDMGVSSVSATITASKPAAFNTYFDSGVRIQVASEIDYTLGIKVGTNAIEFVSMEAGGANEGGAFAGSLDLSTGDLRYEGRMERINCSTSGRCGWNRHIRIYANLKLTSGSPSGLNNFSFGYSNIQSPPGQSGYEGIVVTASGDLTTGVKARGWKATNGSGSAPTAASQYDTVGNWSEVTNSYCYTSASDSASTCGTGIALFSGNTHFVLNNSTHKSPSAFGAAYTGMTFTAVDMSSDTP